MGGGSIAAARAYRLWAPTYEVENPVSVLDEHTVRSLTPALKGRALLDVGCGTGRRLRAVAGSHAKLAVGMDLVADMLKENRDAVSRGRTAAADMRALPVCTESMDVVWCRLVIGHVKDLLSTYEELARVTKPNGTVIVTDFHPEAASNGHKRTFHDAKGFRHTVEHFCHTVPEHIVASSQFGLRLDRQVDSVVGPSVRSFYEAVGRERVYAEQEGLPLVLALRFTL